MNRLPFPGGNIAVLGDIHGRTDMVRGALAVAREHDVEAVVLLGDLFDRADEADACVEAFGGWVVHGVAGNHEREALVGAMPKPATLQLLDRLGEHFIVGDVCFAHEHPEPWRDPRRVVHRVATPASAESNGAHHVGLAGHAIEVVGGYRLVFVGHTHHRSARNEYGPIDVTHGELLIRPNRQYLVNPGALVAGEFAIWDQVANRVKFFHLRAGAGGWL